MNRPLPPRPVLAPPRGPLCSDGQRPSPCSSASQSPFAGTSARCAGQAAWPPGPRVSRTDPFRWHVGARQTAGARRPSAGWAWGRFHFPPRLSCTTGPSALFGNRGDGSLVGHVPPWGHRPGRPLRHRSWALDASSPSSSLLGAISEAKISLPVAPGAAVSRRLDKQEAQWPRDPGA